MGSRILSLLVMLTLVTALPRAASGNVNREIAKKHYELGEKLYEYGDYNKALGEFNKAYDLAPIPALMFNMGRCHEKLGDLKQAVSHYQRFLAAKPNAGNRAEIEEKIKSLKAKMKAAPVVKDPAPVVKDPAPVVKEPAPVVKEPAPVVKDPAPVVKEPAPVVVEEEDDSRPHTWKWVTGWVTLGVGIAAAGGGVALGALAAKRASEFEEGRDGTETYQTLMEVDREGKEAEAAQIGLLVAGGVLTAAGVGLLLWETLTGGENEEPNTASVTPLVGAEFWGLSARLSF
jgi:tetratricopeptide (TPR) repeat protein